MTLSFRTLLTFALMASLVGCATTSAPKPQETGDITREIAAAGQAPATPASVSGPVSLGNEQANAEPPKPEVDVGTGKFINEQAARAPTHGTAPPKGQVVFNFENEPIQAVVKAILGDLLQENYVVAPGVTGNVTYATSQPIGTQEAMPILQTLLSWTHNSLIYKNGRYTVLPTTEAIPGNLTPRLAPAQVAKGYEVRIFQLNYISPSEMQKLLKPFAEKDAFVSVDTSRSLLIMAGTPDQLVNYQRSIDIFDVDWLKGMSVGVYNLQNEEVTKLMPELDQVFGEKGESPLAGMFRFIPIEATNAVVVITPQPEYLAKAQEWLMRLDQGAGGSNNQLYVYNVKNVKAVDLADHLNEIFNGQRPSHRSSSEGSVAPGLNPVSVTGSTIGNNRAERDQSSKNRRESSGSTGGITTGNNEGVRITSVEENNQIMALASPTQWNTIQEAIKRLDVAPLQVQIETKILEVTLTGSLNFGVQWYLEGLIGQGEGSPGGFAQGNNQQQGALGGGGVAPITSPGFFYSYIGPELQGAVRALESNGNTKLVSAPSLVVLNNKEASIQVGTQIPVVQTFFNPGFGSTLNTGAVNGNGTGNTGTGSVGGTSFNTGSVQFRNTGVQLNVTPRVNPGGLVYMEIEQDVSKPGSDAGPTGNVPVDTRSVSTEVAVQSGETVLLGGLIREDDSVTDEGIPFLNRVPILGRLFGTTKRSKTRTELLVLITPKVIGNVEDAREVTREYQAKFQSLAPLRKEQAEQAERRLQDQSSDQSPDQSP